MKARIKVTLVPCEWQGTTKNAFEPHNGPVTRYKVKKVVGSLEPQVGSILKASEAKQLTENRIYEVTIVEK